MYVSNDVCVHGKNVICMHGKNVTNLKKNSTIIKIVIRDFILVRIVAQYTTSRCCVKGRLRNSEMGQSVWTEMFNDMKFYHFILQCQLSFLQVWKGGGIQTPCTLPSADARLVVNSSFQATIYRSHSCDVFFFFDRPTCSWRCTGSSLLYVLPITQFPYGGHLRGHQTNMGGGKCPPPLVMPLFLRCLLGYL